MGLVYISLMPTVEPLITGWLTMPKVLFVGGEEGLVRVPVASFLIRHPKGLVLFDSGLHPTLADGVSKRLGDDLPPGFAVDGVVDAAQQLRHRGIDPDAIQLIINSHLHFDHAGGNILFPNATVIVQDAEWQAAHDPEMQKAVRYFPEDYQTDHAVQTIRGDFDLFGDNTIECFPTPGHTPGHQSLKVEADDRKWILAADACYMRENLLQMRLPGFVWDEDKTRKSLERLASFRNQGIPVVAGHEPCCFRHGQMFGV